MLPFRVQIELAQVITSLLIFGITIFLRHKKGRRLTRDPVVIILIVSFGLGGAIVLFYYIGSLLVNSAFPDGTDIPSIAEELVLYVLVVVIFLFYELRKYMK